MNSGRVHGTSSAFVAVGRPALIHLEMLDFFGRPQSILASDGHRFSLFNSDEQKFYRGPATPSNLARFLSIPLPPEDLVDLMLGGAPRISNSVVAMSFDPKLSAYRVELSDKRLTQRLQIQGTSFRVLQSQVLGPRPYSVEFMEFIPPPLSFPRRILLEVPSAPASVEVRYIDIKLNDVLVPSLFNVPPPQGVEVIELDAMGNSASLDSVHSEQMECPDKAAGDGGCR